MKTVQVMLRWVGPLPTTLDAEGKLRVRTILYPHRDKDDPRKDCQRVCVALAGPNAAINAAINATIIDEVELPVYATTKEIREAARILVTLVEVRNNVQCVVVQENLI